MHENNNDQLINSEQHNGVEILCIGTELLLGNILNSNARWIAEELAVLGLAHYRQTVIGDNFTRVKNAVLEASKRSRILITTGGLGPTPDDLTTEAIASAFKTLLEERKEIWENIQEKLGEKISAQAPSNRKQALLPISAEVIPNLSGTAPGMIWSPKPYFTILTFPGVPSEMKLMWHKSAAKWLKKHQKSEMALVSKTLRFTGITESSLAEKIDDLLCNKNPTVAPYASLGEVKLRITAQSKNTAESNKLIIPIEQEIRLRAGQTCFGTDEESLASVVLEILRKRNETLTVAESCTGGGIGSALTAIPGSSDVFLGGVIAYDNSIKQNILGVEKNLIEQHGAVSKEVVEAMAKGILQKFQSDWTIAVSGIAGPNGDSPNKPIGLVDFCISGPLGTRLISETFNSHLGRIAIQKLSVLKALNQLRLFLLNKS